MRTGVILIIAALGLVILVAGAYLYLNQSNSSFLRSSQLTERKSPAPTPVDETHTIKPRKSTSPNNTSAWIYFSSELYKYSLKYPNNFRIIVGNKNLFQANSKDYFEENGVVKKGAITQVIATDNKKSLEDAWGSIEKTLKSLDIKLLSKEDVTIDGQSAYKIRIENPDGTTEIRYLTYKSPYSFKISILVGKESQNHMDDYEQILDDIISTFNF